MYYKQVILLSVEGMQDLGKKLMVNIIESILQNRIAVNKKQMAQFNHINQ